MKQLLWIVPILVLLISSQVFPQPTEKSRTIKQCEALFGEAIDSKLLLFEVNRDFVLKVDFTGDGLEKLSVVPKYWFSEEHPKWVEPDHGPWLEMKDYRILVAMLEKVRPKGMMTSAGQIGLCSKYCWYKDYYADAFFEYSTIGRDADIGGVGSFFVSFFQPVRGKIVEKTTSNLRKVPRKDKHKIIYTVTISREGDDRPHIFWVREKVYKRLKKGKIQSFEAAFVN